MTTQSPAQVHSTPRTIATPSQAPTSSARRLPVGLLRKTEEASAAPRPASLLADQVSNGSALPALRCGTTASADFCRDLSRSCLRNRPCRSSRQISPGKSLTFPPLPPHLPLHLLDKYRALPCSAGSPRCSSLIRFVSLRSEFCLGLPPHDASRHPSCLQLTVPLARVRRGLPPPRQSTCWARRKEKRRASSARRRSFRCLAGNQGKTPNREFGAVFSRLFRLSQISAFIETGAGVNRGG